MDRAIEVVKRLFRGRSDTYGTFVPGKKFSGDRIAAPLTDDVIQDHLCGKKPIGVYPLVRGGEDGEWLTSWACIDVDRDTMPDAAHQVAVDVAHAGEIKMAARVPVYVEVTKSKQAHIWMFFEEPVPAWQARGLAKVLLAAAGHKEYKRKGGGDEVVICPPHDAPPPKRDDGSGGVGMCMYIPWFGAHAADGRQVFADWKTGAVFPDQVAAMEAAELISTATLGALVDAHDIKPQNVRQMNAKPDDDRYVAKAPAGSIAALTDTEFANLCAKLPALRAMRENPAGCTYTDWFAGLMHLIPFADGLVRAHELSRLDMGRYNAAITDRQWHNAVAMYSSDGQPEARVSQRIVEFWRNGGRPDVIPISPNWCIWNGCFARRKVATMGPEADPTPISNFTAVLVCEEQVDDGTGHRERRFRVKGTMMNGATLPEISVPSKDWTSIKAWLHSGWGCKPVMYADDRYILQCVALRGQEAPERISYTHTGWMKGPDGKMVFLTPVGPRGHEVDVNAFAEAGRVSTPHDLRNYDIPEKVTDAQVSEAYAWVERLMQCGDLAVTAPLVGAMFLAPLSSYLNIDFALFLTGFTGTHKSSLVAAAMALWGRRWSKDTAPTSFNSTANSIEMLGFQAKDLPLLIDNYVPDVKGEAARTLKKISHSIGDHAGRGRLNASAEAVQAKPFRGLCIITGEDVPYAAGSGATNRYYIIPMRRDSLRLMELELVQEAGWAGKLAPAMTHYLSWLSARMQDPEWVQKVVAYQYTLEKAARRAAAGKDHDRLTSQTSWILTGLELARQSNPARAWSSPMMQADCAVAVQAGLMSRRTMSKEASLPYRFLQAFQYLVHSGEIHGVMAHDGNAPGPIDVAALCGWSRIDQAPFSILNHRNSRTAFWIEAQIDKETGAWGPDWHLCIRPDEIVTQIKQSIRTECAIPEGSRGIGQALLSEDLLDATGAEGDRLTPKILLWNKERVRVWRIRGRRALAVLGLNADDAAPPAAN